MEYARGQAVLANNVTDMTIENCTNATLSGCDIYDVGCNAAIVSGGEIQSLSAGNIIVQNNTLHRFARVSRTERVGE
eukprot:COSAG05_NODE_2943_length_2479_cov_1.322269_2_plen_77_part_00